MGRYKGRALQIVDGMEPWFRDINKKRKPDSRDGRTHEEQVFDSGVFAASEFIRRITQDEQLALAVHEVCCWARKARAAGKPLD